MNITEKTNDLIATIENSIADKEKYINELSSELKKEKAQLKKVKALFLQQDGNKGNKTTISEDKPA